MLNELYDEETGVEITDEDAAAGEHEIAEGDVRALRATMIRIFQLQRDHERIKATKAAVTASYDEQLARIDRDEDFLRRSLQAYVERHGQVKFPDVGTAYLASGKPKIEVADQDTFKAELADLFVREVFDETAARAYALEKATTSGEVIAGANLVPAGPRLQIRKA